MKGDRVSIMEKARGQGREKKRLIELALSTILSEIKGLRHVDSCCVQPLTGLCHPIHLWWSWCLYFSFKLVLELGCKREGELCPLVTVNQKENRIPLWALLCKLWHLGFSFPKRNSSSVWAVLGSVCWASGTSSPSTFVVNLIPWLLALPLLRPASWADAVFELSVA